MSQTQSLRKKNSADNSTQPLQRSGTKNNSEALDKKAASAAQQDNAPLQKKAYRSALSSGQSAAQDEPRLQTKLSVSTPGDSHEQEADRVADEVVSRSAAPAQQENKLNPGSTKPENNASNPQSLQTKISRMAEPAPAATEVPQTETESSPAETATDNEQGVSAEVEQQIAGLRGQGEPLPESVRAEMESQFNHDFSSVSIHNDSTADTLCKQLSARAFTVGSDIFFASGEYAPDSQEGKRLLAHELTHVVQQGSGVTRQIMREMINENEFNVTRGEYSGTSINIATKRLEVNKISLPSFKGARNRNKFIVPLRLSSRGDTAQRDSWKNEVNSQVTQRASELVNVAAVNSSGEHFFYGRRNASFVLFGNNSTLVEHFKIPFWDDRAEGFSYQVDHIVERQLGGADTLDNYELLEASANMSSGSRIHNQIDERIRGAIDALRDENTGNTNIPRSSRLDYIKSNYQSDDVTSQRGILFNAVDFNLGNIAGNPGKYWSLDAVKNGEQFDPLLPMDNERLNRLGRSGPLRIYASSAGGEQMPRLPSSPNSLWVPRVRFMEWIPSTDPSSQDAGIISVDVFKSSRSTNVQLTVASEYADYLEEWPVRKINGIHGGYILPEDRNNRGLGLTSGARQSLRLPGMSPVQMEPLGFGANGFFGSGRVLPTVPLIGDADVRILVMGDQVQLRKTFDFGELAVPPPFEISNASLTAFYSDLNGLGLEGRIDFGITRVGEGFLAAEASTRGGFALSGEFNFDDRIFGEGTNAQVRMGYANDQWSMGGTITIPEGKVPGIRTATIDVDYAEASGFSARGNATLNVPGVESGTIEITHNEEEGFVIGGSFNLSQGRGIRGGQISARVQERPDGTGYAVTAHGEAQPDIPGINSNLIVDYNDGAFTAEVSADYSRGMLSGQIHAGVTNRTVNDDGTLAETASENNELVVFGDGELTIQIAPWLQGTAGVRFAPNGEITVIGRIGLPDELEIFARREINRSIFSIAVQAPIFPGIVAEVGGGLSATAGIGPGVIDQLTLQIEYNPAHEEDTHITGDAHLNIPANAGLRLSVRAGIGLGITGASATGGLDIGGTLGIEGAAEAGVHVDWTPATGLDISAVLGVHAQPSFTFDIGGYVSVRALGFEVYDNRWEFASYTFGSDYRFGIRLPIHYREGEPFDISTDDIEFEVPDIDTNQLLRGLIERIA